MGTNGTKGKKSAFSNGSGRRSAFHEKADAEVLWAAFTQPQSSAELKARIDSGTFSLMDRLVAMAHEGNERILCMLTSKLFPDRVIADVQVPQKLFRIDGYRGRDGKWHELPQPANGTQH